MVLPGFALRFWHLICPLAARHPFVQNPRMKVTVDINTKDLRDMIRLSGEKRRDAAVLKFLSNSLQLSRRREVLDKFITGDWSTDGATGSEKKQSWASAS
jgi:hypothetical protein